MSNKYEFYRLQIHYGYKYSERRINDLYVYASASSENDILAKLCEDGWEIISCAAPDTVRIYVLRRELPPKPEKAPSIEI